VADPTAPGWSFGWSRSRHGDPVFVLTAPNGGTVTHCGNPDVIRARLLSEKAVAAFRADAGDEAVDALRAALAVEPTEVEHG
jgi:hypothetical protein